MELSEDIFVKPIQDLIVNRKEGVSGLSFLGVVSLFSLYYFYKHYFFTVVN